MNVGGEVVKSDTKGTVEGSIPIQKYVPDNEDKSWTFKVSQLGVVEEYLQ